MSSWKLIRTDGVAAVLADALLLGADLWITIDLLAAGRPEQYYNEVKYSEAVTTTAYTAQMGMGLLGWMCT